MNESVQDHQGMALVALFVWGSASILGLAGQAGNDIWLAFLLAIVMSLPMIAIFARLQSIMHGSSLKDGIENLYGKWPSRLLALAYGAFAWHLACLVTKNLTEFLEVVSLPTTPQVVPATAFALLALWGVKEGIEVLSRWSVIFFKGLLLTLFVTIILIMTQVDFKEFTPILYDGLKPVFLGALELLDFPFLETILLFWAFGSFKTKGSPYKVMLVGFLVGAFSLAIIASLSLAVLGTEMYALNYFPIYVSISRIDIAKLLTRLEALVSVSFNIGSFLKIAICVLAASKGFAYGLGFSDYRFLVTPLALGIIPGSQFFTKTLMQMDKTATKSINYGNLVFQAAIPILLWIIAEIRTAKKSHQ